MVNLLCKCIVFPNLLILSTMVVSSEMPQNHGIYLLWSIYYVNASCFLTFLFYRLWLYQARCPKITVFTYYMVNLLCKCIVFPNVLILSTMVVSSEMPQNLGIYLLWSIYYVNASCFLTFLFYRLWLYQARCPKISVFTYYGQSIM